MLTPLHNVKSVLIIRCGALGDLIYATAVMDALQRRFGPEVRIDWVCSPGTAGLFEKDPRVHRVFRLRQRNVPLWLSPEKLHIVRQSQKAPYDLLLTLERGKQFTSLTAAVRAAHKVAAPPNKPKNLIDSPHAADRIKEMCAPVIDLDILRQSEPRLYGETYEVLKERYSLPERYLVVNASNSHIKKQRINYRAWPQHHWKKLLELIGDALPVVMIGAKGEDAYFNEIRPFPPTVVDLVGKTPLIDLIGILEHAAAVVTTDTGPAHMAAAVSTPVYVLIGPTPAEETGPYRTARNEVHIISKNLACAPCYRTPVMEACNDNRCMKEITPETVYERLRPVLHP